MYNFIFLCIITVVGDKVMHCYNVHNVIMLNCERFTMGRIRSVKCDLKINHSSTLYSYKVFKKHDTRFLEFSINGDVR